MPTQTPKETATVKTQFERAMPATRAPNQTTTVGPEQALAVAERARGALGVSAMLALQNAAGNRAVVGLGQVKAGPSVTAGAQAMGHRAAFAGLETEGSATPGRAVVQRTLAAGGGAVVGREPAPRSPGAPVAHAAVHAAAARGTTTPAQTLPFAASIQRVFGRHDISGIRAHVGGDANASAEAMGAEAYAVGDHVVLPPGADLFTAAHEAAHVVQQRGGVRPAGGVGSAGDAYEQHADAVAKLVIEGKSAEQLLDKHASGGPAPAPGAAPVQHKLRKFGDIKVLGKGFSWRDHATQFDDRDGAQLETTAYGLGALVDRTHDAPDSWTVLPTYGLPDPLTTEATSVDVPRLGPIVAPQPAAPPTMRPLNLGHAIQIAAKVGAMPVYQEAQLLPARFGGSPGANNLVALPTAAKADLETHGHGMIDRLVGKAGAWIAYHATAVPATEKIDTTDIHYTGAVRVAWAELNESGALIDGTHGQFQVSAPKPSEYATGTTVSVPASAPAKLGAHDNRALSPAPRHDDTALTWRTEITWGATHACGDGTRMEARRLGPDHKQGDEPAHKEKNKVKNPSDHYIWDQRTSQLSSAAGGRAYIAGHLLNHHVGGPGNDARNLAAIPSDVNTKMAADVEGPVKNLVNHKHAWLYYKAEVNHVQDPGSANAWYADRFSFQWHQLEARTGRAVPGTAGNVSYAIQAPSMIGANKPTAKNAKAPATFTPTLGLPTHGAVQPATAVTTPAFDELVLEESSALRPLLIYQESLIGVLRKMRLDPQFATQSDVELSTSIANVMARYKPDAAETAAWTKIAALDVEITALDPHKLSDLQSFATAGAALRDAIGAARTERRTRMGKLAAAVHMKLTLMHDKDFAIEAWKDFDGAVKSYTAQIEQAEAVALTLVEYARKASIGALTDKRNILDAANALRAWLGQPPLDDTTDTQPLPSQLIGHTVSLANQSFGYSEAPRSPGEWYGYSEKYVKQGGPTDLKRVKSTVVHDANEKMMNLEIPSQPSNTLLQLVALAQTHHAEWPLSVPVEAQVGGTVHATMSGIVKNIHVAGYEPYIHIPAIQALYEQDIPNTQRYLAFLKKSFGKADAILI